jgi:preprotein translocase subunit YajC
MSSGFPASHLEASTARCGKEHAAPSDGCRCGIYAAKNFQHLVDIGYAGYGVHGEVYLWGTVVEHRLGWRAQFAYPRTLVLPSDAIPFKMSQAESRLETLMAYGVDIAIASAAPIPLWSKRSGYDQAGLDLLIEKRKRWYSYQERERRLKDGDRVAVLGQGIGVVASADTNDVHVLMWNKVTLRLPRKRVVWSRQNWRWEGTATGSFTRKMSRAAVGRAE